MCVVRKIIKNVMPDFACRHKGTMVTYGGMAKQPVTAPVVSECGVCGISYTDVT